MTYNWYCVSVVESLIWIIWAWVTFPMGFLTAEWAAILAYSSCSLILLLTLIFPNPFIVIVVIIIAVKILFTIIICTWVARRLRNATVVVLRLTWCTHLTCLLD